MRQPLAALSLLLLSALPSCAHRATEDFGAGLACDVMRYIVVTDAVVEEDDSLVVAYRMGGTWRIESRLPKNARVLRISQNREVAAWVEDTSGPRPSMRGFVKHVYDNTPVELGPLGFRRFGAAGLDVNEEHVAFLAENGDLVSQRVRVGGSGEAVQRLGRGSQVILDPFGHHAYVDERGCLQGVSPPLCEPAIRPLEEQAALLASQDHLLLVRTNTALLALTVTPSGTYKARELNLRDVLDARAHAGRVLVLHRVDDGGTAVDAVSIWSSSGDLREVSRASIIISAEWGEDGSVLLVRRKERSSIYDLLLAHAPEEFGGESMSGEAVRINPETKEEFPVEGLAGRQVRLVREHTEAKSNCER